MITVRQALTRATDQLSMHPELRPTALPDAALLLMHSLGVDRATLIAHPERPLDREQQASYQRLVERRLRFEPIQYILGQQDFYGLTLRVTPAVLIPRPETELLVEAVLARIPHRQPRILDVGTGSGAISIALAHSLPQAQVTAIDLSPEALDIARENAAKHAPHPRSLQSAPPAALPHPEPFHIIVSNPPYIPASDAPTLHPQVREHEPAQALFAGPDGLDLYTRLIPQAAQHLTPGGLLALELGHGQQPALALLLKGWQHVTFLNDLQHIPRVILAFKPT